MKMKCLVVAWFIGAVPLHRVIQSVVRICTFKPNPADQTVPILGEKLLAATHNASPKISDYIAAEVVQSSSFERRKLTGRYQEEEELRTAIVAVRC